ncbi:MAG: hypothetical protein H6Q75_1354 [Firmicutes bacterium]|nr:hypothetical protein [Bacillota bacterium]
MRCAIMQPTYLPWAGYFNLISQVDCFVFLDDVQFERRSWQCRNRILVNGKVTWLTVPVKADSREQIIEKIEVDGSPKWRDKQVTTLHHSYAKHPYRRELDGIIDCIKESRITRLADLNMAIIRHIAEKLELRPRFYQASEINAGGRRSEHLFDICRYLNCNEYLSPVGSSEYLMEDGVFTGSDIKLLFQDYSPQAYFQTGQEEFQSHLSIVDVIANLGWAAARQYITGAGGTT